MHAMGFRRVGMAAAIFLFLPAMASAQGPREPPASNPQAKPGATIVINPTEQECRQGWNSSMRWTREQFDAFCETLRKSK